MTSTRDEAPRTSAWGADASLASRGGGGVDGDTPWYKLYRYVPPQREYVMRRFGLEIGYGFWETKGVYERIYRLIPNAR